MISTNELRRATDLLISYLEDHGINKIDITDDFYWETPVEERYDSYTQPKNLNVGQLSYDLCEIMRIVQGDTPPIGQGFIWLSAILRRIGETSPI